MSAAPLAARLETAQAALARALPEAEAERTARRAALARLNERGLPTTREENWRYANLRPLERAVFAPPLALAAPSIEAARALLPPPLPDYERIVIVDGLRSEALSDSRGGKAASSERAAGTQHAIASNGSADARLAELARAFAPEELSIRVPPRTPRAVEIVCVATTPATAATSYPSLAIDVADGATLSLIERQLSLADEATLANARVSVNIGHGARLHHVRVQDCGPRASHFETLEARVGEDSEYALDSIAFGAAAARTTLHVALAGARASLRLAGAAALDGTQVNDTFARVEHEAPCTRTEESFRGIAAGRSRVAFNGLIVMQRGAAGSASRQSLRSLLAGPGAEADMRPQLEIYTDDVQASHGATAGKLDDAMLFYLLSRGLDPREAESLLKWTFIAEIVARVGIPALRAQLEQALARRFAQVAPLAAEIAG